MAKINLGDNITAISGSTGGTTYSRNKGGWYRKNKPIPTNPNTSYQVEVRQRFTMISNSWKSMTSAQRLLWQTEAVNYPYTDSLGNTRIPSSFQFFQSFNMTMLTCTGNTAVIEVPPVFNSQVFMYAGGWAINSAGTPKFTYTSDDDALPNAYNQIWATPILSPGKTPANSDYRLLGTFPISTDDATLSTDVSAAYLAKFGSIASFQGQRIAIKMIGVNDASVKIEGYKSNLPIG